MTEPHFDELIHAPYRLRACSMLAAVDSLAFAAVRDALSVSDSVLSKHIRLLVEAGYVTMTKTRNNTPVRTWLTLTPAGRAALAAHLAELQRIANLAGLPDSG